MMTKEDVVLLRSEALRRAIDENIERDPNAIALDRHIPHAQLVATQVKYLQRARRKLPHLYEARCIIPPRAFEQSSSEDSAERKQLSGESLLDLCCGLGIDAMAASRRFRRVVAVERDEVLAEVVRYNLTLLGIENVEVVSASAEEYIDRATEHFDWVFLDPDRRSEEGRKLVRMEDCSPNVMAMMPRLEAIASRVALKLSPLFDVEEALRLFPRAEVEVVSMAGECKELNLYTGCEHSVVRVAIVGQGEWHYVPEAMSRPTAMQRFTPEGWRYLLIPDVALQKSRLVVAALGSYASIWSNNGYGFAVDAPPEDIPARVLPIVSIERYRPKELKRAFKGLGVDILKRDTQLSVDGVRKAIGVHAGADRRIAITTIERENWVIELDAYL